MDIGQPKVCQCIGVPASDLEVQFHQTPFLKVVSNLIHFQYIFLKKDYYFKTICVLYILPFIFFCCEPIFAFW